MLLTPSLAIRVASDIKPMPPPTFAEMWRREQLIDQSFVSVRAFVSQEGFGFSWFWRQARQIKRGPAHESEPIRFGRQRQTFLFQLLKHEGIDWVADPVCVSHFGNFHRLRRAKRPELSIFFANQWISEGAGHLWLIWNFRRAKRNPTGEFGYLVGFHGFHHGFDQARLRRALSGTNAFEHQTFI